MGVAGHEIGQRDRVDLLADDRRVIFKRAGIKIERPDGQAFERLRRLAERVLQMDRDLDLALGAILHELLEVEQCEFLRAAGPEQLIDLQQLLGLSRQGYDGQKSAG